MKVDINIASALRGTLPLICCGMCVLATAAQPPTSTAVAAAADTKVMVPSKGRLPAEQQQWEAIQAARSPRRIVELSRAYQRKFPQGSMIAEARELEAGASRVKAILPDVGLSDEFFSTATGSADFSAKLLGAARGDADAALALARAYGEGKSGVTASLYRQEQWLRLAAELGHAEASWELAQIENRNGRVAEAAHYEKRALVFGYKPPPRLSNRDY